RRSPLDTSSERCFFGRASSRMMRPRSPSRECGGVAVCAGVHRGPRLLRLPLRSPQRRR
ncbi:unnamed protein product, partial [Phaeothamnion confervicola]